MPNMAEEQVECKSLLSEVHGATLELVPDVTFLLASAANGNPDVPAIVSLHQSHDLIPSLTTADRRSGYLSWTYSQLRRGAALLASRLARLGLSKGRSIAIFSYNRAEWALFFWAAVQLGCVFVPFNPRVISREEEVQHMLGLVRPAVLVVADELMAKDLEQLLSSQVREIKTKIVLSEWADGDLPKWISLPHLLATPPEKRTGALPGRVLEDVVAIQFTSGTTSLPKACVQSSRNLCVAAMAMQDLRDLHSVHRTVQHLPPFSAMGVLFALTFWISGATVVYPSPTFDAELTLDAIEKQHCTHMMAVPTMIKALASHSSLARRNLTSLISIELGGAVTHAEILKMCTAPDKLRARRASVCYGMSESPATLFVNDKRKESRTYDTTPVGTPIPGSKIKVCEPGSRIPIARGQSGELHLGGAQVVRGYLDANSDTFYQEVEDLWVATGDQAMVDETGSVHILGRFKDIIIRGGENIAPATIERCLDKIPGVESQVVGVPDEVAGEIPIAVVKRSKESMLSTTALQELALRELGPELVPQMVLDLHKDLRLESFPATTSGKLKKFELAKVVQNYVREVSQRALGGATDSTEELLAKIWSSVSGVAVANISFDRSVLSFVDSITVMRFTSAIKKNMRKIISVDDVYLSPTIHGQTRLLNSRQQLDKTDGSLIKRAGPPGAADMVHTREDPQIAKRTEAIATPVLAKLGLRWDDVEDVLPVTDFGHFFLRRRRPQTWNQRHVYVAQNANHDQLLDAWKACLHHHPMLRTIALDFDQEIMLHVVMRPNERWFNASLRQDLEVKSIPELRSTFKDEFADLPGPLVRVAVVRIQDTGKAGLVFVGNHSTYDALSVGLLLDDLNSALSEGPESVRARSWSHGAYKYFADACYIHRQGPAAKAAIDITAKRLTGIHKLKNVLWPPQKAPGWFKGNDRGWCHDDGSEGKPDERRPLDAGKTYGLDGLSRTVKAPHLNAMKEEHDILPHVILKAACALFNIRRTGENEALFCNVEAARSWPFTEDWTVDSHLPNPIDIAGPLFTPVINRIPVEPNQRVRDLLLWIQENQKEITRYAHAPLFEVRNSLPKEDADMLWRAIQIQGFNWAPDIQGGGRRTPRNALAKFQRESFDDIGLAWTAGLLDPETFYLNASFDDCQLSAGEVKEALGEVLSAGAWLGDPVNLEKEVNQCVFEGVLVSGLIASLE